MRSRRLMMVMSAVKAALFEIRIHRVGRRKGGRERARVTCVRVTGRRVYHVCLYSTDEECRWLMQNVKMRLRFKIAASLDVYTEHFGRGGCRRAGGRTDGRVYDRLICRKNDHRAVVVFLSGRKNPRTGGGAGAPVFTTTVVNNFFNDRHSSPGNEEIFFQ